MFATTPNELTAAGFERHDAHAAVEAPLTEEERSLGEVRRAEQHEAARGTGVREIHLSKTMNMPVGEDALAALKEMADPEGGRGAGHAGELPRAASLGRLAGWLASLTPLLTRTLARKSTPIPKASSWSTAPARPHP